MYLADSVLYPADGAVYQADTGLYPADSAVYPADKKLYPQSRTFNLPKTRKKVREKQFASKGKLKSEGVLLC